MSDVQGTADPAGAPAPGRRVRSLAGVAAVALLVAVVGGVVGVHQLGARGGGGASAGAGPSSRLGAAIGYDPSSGQTVLFGGQGPDGRGLGDTWTWDGASWTLQHPRHSPSARTGAAMAADRSQHDVVLFGGTRAPSGAVTCRVNGEGAATGGGASAAPMPPVPPVPSCSSPAPGPLTDTWTWDGQDWTQRQPSASPSLPAAAAHMAWDARSGRVLLVEARGYAVPAMYPANRSGVEPDMVLPGTGAGAVYAWQGANWVKVGPAAAEPVAPVLVAADPATGSVLMVGQAGLGYPCAALRATVAAGPAMMCPLGIDSSAAGPAAGATDGGVASSGGGASSSGEGTSGSVGGGVPGRTLAPACPPPASPGAVVNCAVILAAPPADAPPTCPAKAGCPTCPSTAVCAAPPTCPANAPCPTMPPTPGGPGPDCRAVHSCPVPPAPVVPSLVSATWSGRSWSTVAGAGGPPMIGAMATDPADNGVLGLAFDGGTWVWDGHRWALRHNAGGPSTRNGAALAEDARGHVVLVGGLAAGGFAGDTWTWDGSRWTRRGGTAPTLPPKPSAEPPSSTPVPPAPSAPATPGGCPPARLEVGTTAVDATPFPGGSPRGTSIEFSATAEPPCAQDLQVTLRLLDAAGHPLAVQGNPFSTDLALGAQLAGAAKASGEAVGKVVTWSNWCGGGQDATVEVIATGLATARATAPAPACVEPGKPSALTEGGVPLSHPAVPGPTSPPPGVPVLTPPPG